MEFEDELTSKRAVRGASAYALRRETRLETTKDIGFIMDNVKSVLHLQNILPRDKAQLVYVEDPILNSFPGKVKQYKGDTLVIEVRKSELRAYYMQKVKDLGNRILSGRALK